MIAAPHSRAPGMLLLGGGVLALAAAAMVPAWRVVVATPAEALEVVPDVRAWYQLASVLGAICGIVAVAGVAALAGAVIPSQPPASGRRALAFAGFGTLGAGILLWLVAAVASSTNLLMTDAQGGVSTDVSYLVITEIGHVLWLTSFTTMAFGFGFLGCGLRTSAVVAGWARWLAWLAAAALVVLVAVVHDVPSFTVFLVALPLLGVASFTARPRP